MFTTGVCNLIWNEGNSTESQNFSCKTYKKKKKKKFSFACIHYIWNMESSTYTTSFGGKHELGQQTVWLLAVCSNKYWYPCMDPWKCTVQNWAEQEWEYCMLLRKKIINTALAREASNWDRIKGIKVKSCIHNQCTETEWNAFKHLSLVQHHEAWK